MEANVDVVIIGGGPAGVSAAITLNRERVKVIVINKPVSSLSKDEMPLETVHPGIETLLKSIGAEKILFRCSKATYNGITTNGVFNPLSLNPDEIWSGNHISRTVFNALLLECAKAQNITIIEDEGVDDVSVTTQKHTVMFKSGKKIECKYIIDASGRTKLLGKKLGLYEKFYSPSLTAWSGVTTDIDTEYFKSIVTSFIPSENGWTWLAPESVGRCTWTKLSKTKKGGFLPPSEFMNYVNNTKISSANVRWRVFRPIVNKRVLLTGDAAGNLDPAAGQGILNALYSGIMASRTIIASLNQPFRENQFMIEYDKWFFQNFEEKVFLLKEYYKENKIQLFEI